MPDTEPSGFARALEQGKLRLQEPGAGGVSGLQRLAKRRQAGPTEERCELCAEPLGSEHPHLVDVETRGLKCACRACMLLFTHSGAAGGRYRAVPDRYLYDPAFALSAGQWDALQIPVQMAFFFSNSSLSKVVGFYPSPAGATESLLPLDVWDEVMAANPAMADMADDVEGLLLRRTNGSCECFLVPIDVCYELVGRVRRSWKGFDGGQEVWADLDAFFAKLRDRSRVVGDGAGAGAAP